MPDNVSFYIKLHSIFALIAIISVYIRYLYVKEDYSETSWELHTLKEEYIFKAVIGTFGGPLVPIYYILSFIFNRINHGLEKIIKKIKRKNLDKNRYKVIKIKSNHTLIGKLTLNKDMMYTIIEVINSKKMIILNNEGQLIEISTVDINIL